MDSIKACEGLIQGDAAALRYCQLLVADVCDKVRAAFPTTHIGSYFDDSWTKDQDFDRSMQAFKALELEFHHIGGSVNRSKNVVFLQRDLLTYMHTMVNDEISMLFTA